MWKIAELRCGDSDIIMSLSASDMLLSAATHSGMLWLWHHQLSRLPPSHTAQSAVTEATAPLTPTLIYVADHATSLRHVTVTSPRADMTRTGDRVRLSLCVTADDTGVVRIYRPDSEGPPPHLRGLRPAPAAPPLRERR